MAGAELRAKTYAAELAEFRAKSERSLEVAIEAAERESERRVREAVREATEASERRLAEVNAAFGTGGANDSAGHGEVIEGEIIDRE